ncbi:putative toxin-antitoxin system toxin component, PIN family [Rosistilla oblonga]|uniref:putative toxin-antitoxin system toxin component, PIN family n=1 Tax=Rosistilla oblonga TaxID=2527990 RepID=UPI003A97B612
MKIVCPPVVLDTNVLVAGACRQEQSMAYRVLMAVLNRRVPLMLTEGIIAEYTDVLSRPTVRKLIGLTAKQNSDLILELISLSHQTQLRFSWRPNLSDEADNKFIEAAIAATAIIITYNVRDFDCADLVKHGWDVMTPIEFWTLYDLGN